MAGSLTTGTIQINDNATAANNFCLVPDNAGGVKLARGNHGATTQDILTVDASGNLSAVANINAVSIQQGGVAVPRMVLGTAQNTTSGTAIDFTGIPSWAKKITVMLNGVSKNGTSGIVVQIGDGTINTTGYSSQCTNGNGGATTSVATAYFFATRTVSSASDIHSGHVVLTLVEGNTWVATNNVGATNNSGTYNIGAGSKTLSSTLDRVRLTTVNGTDQFNAGSVNILIEG